MRRIEQLQEIWEMRFSEVEDRYRRGRLTATEAAELLGVCDRTFRRMRERYEVEGMAGLSDRRVGKVSPHRIGAAEVERITELYRSRYKGWSVKHFHERATSQHDLLSSYSWTKGVLHGSGLVSPAVKRSAHRKRRERKPLPGMMMHQDGSTHLWVPALDHNIDLIVTMDDATSEIYSAFFTDEEGTDSSFRGVHEVIERHGLFCTLYTDRGSHYFYTPAAGEKVSKGTHTQFGRALAQLGVKHIPAYSPEARGRSERMFGTLQGRLVKEIVDAGIETMEDANRYLSNVYLPDHNSRFSIEASEAGTAFIPWTGGDLNEILCQQEERQVGKDNTVSFERLKLQIEPSPLRAHFVKATVMVRRYADRSIGLFYGPRCIGRYDANGLINQTTSKAA
jgi:transposase